MVSNVLQLQVNLFDNNLCEAVEYWLNDMKSDSDAMDRINALMKTQSFYKHCLNWLCIDYFRQDLSVGCKSI